MKADISRAEVRGTVVVRAGQYYAAFIIPDGKQLTLR